jgi:predicted  nucleic acid-binding Zn-ribbon protein
LQKEDFKILKELNSLNQAISKLQITIQDELSRIDKIQHQRDKRQIELDLTHDKLKANIRSIQESEAQISHFSKLHSSALQKSNTLVTEHEISSLQTQIDNAKVQIDHFENKGLELLDVISNDEEIIKNAKTFLAGSLESINEIESEINQSNHKILDDIKTKKSRISLLTSSLPTAIITKFEYLTSKGSPLGPLTQITDSNNCEACGYLLHKSLVSAIEIKNAFHTCSGCERIIIPQNVKFL